EWQLDLLNKSIKKKNKLNKLNEFLDPQEQKTCLDIGCGTGAISYALRKQGEIWHSIDSDESCVNMTLNLVKENVHQMDATNTNFENNKFDTVIALDIIEHIEDDDSLVKELKRILKDNGKLYVTTPHISRTAVLNYIKNWIGLTPDKYGHVRPGYTTKQLKEKLEKNGFTVEKTGTYSKFFTEITELIINKTYTIINKNKTKGYNTDVSPATQNDLNKTKGIKLYKILYKPISLFTKLDYIWPCKGYGLIMKAEKTTS
ncbi:class I SAM-dependent methyltransferase, partial [archaeon]|nr:class I SAM-dependent methyltransferase [archaeon]